MPAAFPALADLLLIGKVKGFPRKPQRIAGAGKRGVYHVQRHVAKIGGGQSAAESSNHWQKAARGSGMSALVNRNGLKTCRVVEKSSSIVILAFVQFAGHDASKPAGRGFVAVGFRGSPAQVDVP